MTLSLRPYQNDAVAACRDGLRRAGVALLVMATGTGKTETALSMIWGTLERGGRVLFIAHRSELVASPLERAARYWPKDVRRMGRIQASKRQVDRDFVSASVRSLVVPERLAAYLEHGIPRLVVWDEAHHTPAPTWATVRQALDAAARKAGQPIFHLGLTATPEGEGLHALWGDPVYSYSLRDAQRSGFLTVEEVKVRRMTSDLTPEQWATLDDNELGAELVERGIVDHTVAVMAPYRGERSALVYTSTVSQAEATAAGLRSAGWRAAVMWGGMKTRARTRTLADLREGKLDAVCNADMLTEGTDITVASLAVIARACRSSVLYRQICGRVLRLHCPEWRRSWGLMNRLDARYVKAGGQIDAVILDISGASDELSLDASAVCIETGAPGMPRDEYEPDPSKPKRKKASGWPFMDRYRTVAPWCRVRGLDREVLAAHLGREGTVWLADSGEGWRGGFLRGAISEGFATLSHSAMGREEAIAVGDDVARRVREQRLRDASKVAPKDDSGRPKVDHARIRWWPEQNEAALRAMVLGLGVAKEDR